jgi:hypothetical protein
MDARDLLPYRTPLIGGLVALSVGLGAGLVLRTGSQVAPPVDSYALSDNPYAEAEPSAWPGGKVPDHVVGTDFLDAQRPDPPVVAVSYDVPEYVAPVAGPEAEAEAEFQAQPARPVEPSEPRWASTSGDILDVRLPEDPPAAPEPSQAPEAPVAPNAPVPMAAARD